MTETSLPAAVVQHACGPDRDRNLAASRTGIRQAADAGARLVLLPELHANPYFCRTADPAQFDLAEPVPGPTTASLGQLAAKTGVVIVGSVFEQRAPGIAHNTAVVLDADGRLAGRYRKMHIPDDPGYYEKFYFTPGDDGFTPIDTAVGRLGVLVCWDQWFPEAARLMALAGAEVLLYPSAIGWDAADNGEEQARQYDAWQTVQRGHAIANHLPLLVSNRVGHEGMGADAIEFWGGSFAAGPQGEILAEADTQPQVVMADLPIGRSQALRRIWPFFRDRRIDAYDALSQRYRG